ncbi:MAG: diguanylate cyclase (GGDEF)-like protein/PAS domain S-box-containing protein [Methylophilaceae bacterium]|jgi:diguanylate cyclase (GGDEF)-like protein/PAS domain S-box-containing protein
MTSSLQAKDCLCSRVVKVDALQKYHDIVTKSDIKPNVFAVFDEEGRFLDIVEARQAALFPGRMFSDLIVRKAAKPLSSNTSLNKVQARFDSEKCKFVTVINNKQFIGVISRLSLITALISQEKELQHQRNSLIEQLEVELNYRNLATVAFENISEGILITDAKAYIIHVNRGFTNTTGYDLEDVVGKTPAMLRSGGQGKKFYQSMWKTLIEIGSWKGELWNRRKNGDIYPEWLSVNAMYDSDNKVVNYVGVFSDIGSNKKLQEDLHQLAFFDPLTNLPNRRLLFDRLQQAMTSSERDHHHGGLFFIDLDNFKTLNDTKGHDFGDLLLQEVSQRLLLCVRKGDTVARLGGDEFVIMLKGLPNEITRAATQTKLIANKILINLNEVYTLEGFEYHGSASIGINLFCASKAPIEDLLKQADIAMYQAKSKGRNNLCFFDPVMQEDLNTRTDIERDIRLAIENNEFQLYYQLQLNSANQPLGAEALIRWIHPKRGIVPPLQFIPLAEETNLILPLGQWVIEAALAQLKTWEQNTLTRELTLSINVSANQFNQSDFVEQVQASIQKYAINPALLNLELTEGMLINDIDSIIIKMTALQAIGVHFELDDFGTGYSSLHYLKKLPLSQLKIDQSFVLDITTNSSDRVIAKTIIAMAQSMNLNVIAEGVETESQLAYLKEDGCNHFQGYLFGKPMPIKEFEASLMQGGF